MQSCRPVEPHAKFRDQLAQRAWQMNPVNMPSPVVPPQHVAMMTSKYWGANRDEITVAFLDSTTSAFRDKVIKFANMWQSGIVFRYTTGDATIRISTGSGGYYAYLGTDMSAIPTNRHNMNLQGFTTSTRDSEWYRVVCHEFGHSMGFPHEHARPEVVDQLDPNGCYSYFRRTSGWSRSTVDQQILTPLDESQLTATEVEETSIMAYTFPAECTKDGVPIAGGTEITDQDRTFAQEMYPPEVDPEDPSPPEVEDPPPLEDSDEWDLDNYDEIDWSD